MISRSVHMIFEASGQPVPTEDEVRFEAREIVQRTGWGLPLIERLRKVADPYWREAIARCLMDRWNELVRDKDERTYYYDSDGDIRFCWMDADYDFNRIIRNSCHEQADKEQTAPAAPLTTPEPVPVSSPKTVVKIYIQENYGTINTIDHSHVTIHQQ